MASSETERNLRSQPTTWHTPFSAITCGQPRVAKAIGWREWSPIPVALLHTWNNTAQDWLRLQAALVILHQRPQRTHRRAESKRQEG